MEILVNNVDEFSLLQPIKDQQYLYTLDISVIATGFAQLVDEGLIEVTNKPIVQLAISRQIIWAELSTDSEHAAEYIDNLKSLNRALTLA